MPNKTIYVKDDDVTLFDEAEALSGDSLSRVIADALREFVEAKKKRAARRAERGGRAGE